MRYLYIILFTLTLITPISEVSATCLIGAKECNKLKNDNSAYNACIKNKCGVTNKRIQNKTSCDVGNIRCERLKFAPAIYDVCILETCQKYDMNQLKCNAGKKQCQDSLGFYYNCIYRNCNKTYNICERGKSACQKNSERYWFCLSDNCLGNLNKYFNLKSDEIDNFRSKILKEKQEIQKYTTPKERILTNKKRRQMKCRKRNVNIFCSSNDIISCVCSDGTLPKFE